MTRIIAALLMWLLPMVAYSQTSDLGNWLIYFGNKQLSKKVNWHSEAQYRNYSAVGDLEQLLLRTGIGYDLTDNNNNVLMGYGYILSENYVPNTDEKATVEEHRIYQQFITKQQVGSRVSLQHRYRFEQRWIEEDFRLRLRYFLGINVFVNDAKTIYLSAYNEIFMNTVDSAFDRNRLYGGLGYKLNDLLRFELGYMNQFLQNGNRDQINMISFVTF